MWCYLLSLALVGIDQAVKFWIRDHLTLGERVVFIPGIMDLTYAQNTGAAFSSFSNMTAVLTLISLTVSIGLAIAIARKIFPDPFGLLSLTLLLAGAVGNLIDRAMLGFVTDMFSTSFMDFAIFNVADVCVTAGAVLLAVRVFTGEAAEW